MANVADQIPDPYGLLRRLDDLEREVRELRASRGSSAPAFRGGAFRLLDDAGAPRFAAGHVDLDGSVGGDTSAYGVFVFGDDGAMALMVQEGYAGISYPANLVPLHPPTPAGVTSGTFQTIVEGSVLFPAHEVLYVEGSVTTPAGTTGELRLTEGYSGTSTDALVIPSDTNSVYLFRWVHPGPSGLYDGDPHVTPNLFVGLQARRTGGAGNLTVYPPRSAELTSRFVHRTAATNGDPVLL